MASGHIRHRELYAQGKMLDHSGWRKVLKRGITPSDIDMVYDFSGTFLFVELKTTSPEYNRLPTGQRILLRNLVKLGGGKVYGAVALVRAKPDKDVDTVEDVLAFQVITLNEISPILPGSDWKKFVKTIEEISYKRL